MFFGWVRHIGTTFARFSGKKLLQTVMVVAARSIDEKEQQHSSQSADSGCFN